MALGEIVGFSDCFGIGLLWCATAKPSALKSMYKQIHCWLMNQIEEGGRWSVRATLAHIQKHLFIFTFRLNLPLLPPPPSPALFLCICERNFFNCSEMLPPCIVQCCRCCLVIFYSLFNAHFLSPCLKWNEEKKFKRKIK